MQRIGNNIPIFIDASGSLMDGGQIYVGEVNADPQTTPIVAYWDLAMTQVAEQPIRTIGGRIVNGTAPAAVFIAETNYSMRVMDFYGVVVDYSPNVFGAGIQFQELSPVLTALAALQTTTFGQSLLTLANQKALVAATGLTPFTGGPVTSQITKAGAGAYFGASGLTGCTIYIVPTGTADPTSAPGDIVFYY